MAATAARRRIKRSHLLLLLLVGLLVIVFAPGGVSIDPESIKQYALRRLADQFPGATLVEQGPTTVEVRHPNGRHAVADIGPAQAICRERPRKCIDAVDDVLIGLMQSLEPSPEAGG